MLAVLCLLGIVVEVGNLWLARAELRNALEAGALAAVDSWGDSGADTPASRNTARTRAVTITGLNTVNGQSVVITTGDVILGDLAGTSPYVVCANQPPSTDRAAHIQATVTVSSLIGSACGNLLSPFPITTNATARYDSDAPKIIRISGVK